MSHPARSYHLMPRYPHIHGPLNRDAIVAVTRAMRNEDGSFG